MAVNQVIVGDEVKLDLTTDTVSEETLLEGVTAHNAAGEPIVGTMAASGGGGSGEQLTIENAVVIKQSDSAYILHNFTETNYIAGNKIGYAGAQNRIIAQEYIAYNKSAMTTGNMAAIPDYQFYTDVIFEKPVFIAYSSYAYEISRIYYRHKVSYNTYDQYELVFVKTDGTEVVYNTTNAYRTHSEPVCKFAFGWENIYPPGYSTPKSQLCEYGCAYVFLMLLSSIDNASTPYTLGQLGNSIYKPYIQFSSEAEYNAAVGLTYEPNALTVVTDSTEVTG